MERLIQSRPHYKSWHFPLILKWSTATFSFLSALCISSLTSAGSSWRSGTRHPDNKEKMRGAEAVKGNIPSNVPPFSPLCLRSLLSVPTPTLQPLFPSCTPSRALHGEQEAGLGTGSLLSPSQGKRVWDVCLGEGGHFPNYEPESNWQPCTRDPGEITESEKAECTGAKRENQHTVDEHNNTHCAHQSFIWGIIKQSSIWHKESLGKICWA